MATDNRVASASQLEIAPAIGYATVNPLTMLLRVLAAQLLVLLFMR